MSISFAAAAFRGPLAVSHGTYLRVGTARRWRRGGVDPTSTPSPRSASVYTTLHLLILLVIVIVLLLLVITIERVAVLNALQPLRVAVDEF
jgi:hypothetical protein